MDKKSVVERKIHEEKAHRIVIKLAIETVDETTLLSIIRFIEPYHYEEIIEERFLSKICGYPICNAPLKKVTLQQFSFLIESVFEFFVLDSASKISDLVQA